MSYGVTTRDEIAQPLYWCRPAEQGDHHAISLFNRLRTNWHRLSTVFGEDDTDRIRGAVCPVPVSISGDDLIHR
jgi:hypothetical protein